MTLGKPMAASLVSCVLTAALVTTLADPARSAKKPALSEAVERSIQTAFPGAEIDEANPEKRIVELTEVTIEVGEQEYDLVVGEDGTIVSVTRLVDPDDLPGAVLEGLRGVEKKEKIREAERTEVLAELRPVRLDAPRVEYGGKFKKGGKELEVFVTESGRFLRTAQKLRYED